MCSSNNVNHFHNLLLVVYLIVISWARVVCLIYTPVLRNKIIIARHLLNWLYAFILYTDYSEALQTARNQGHVLLLGTK